MNGIVKNVKSEKGFGFIKAEDGREYFFHYTGLIDCELRELIPEKTKVEFEVTSSAKGPRAESVKIVE